jgi:acetoacetyl-CoA reductase
MGGLGETISTKMADAGYKVIVTYSPGNTKHNEWMGDMKARGYDMVAVACDEADIDSCAKAVTEVQAKRSTCWSTTRVSPATRPSRK